MQKTIQISDCDNWRNKTNSTSNKPSGYESWLDYWEKNTNTKFPICCVNGCAKSAKVGAHVYRKHDCANVYIAPYCSEHNNYRNDNYNTLKIGTKLIPAH